MRMAEPTQPSGSLDYWSQNRSFTHSGQPPTSRLLIDKVIQIVSFGFSITAYSHVKFQQPASAMSFSLFSAANRNVPDNGLLYWRENNSKQAYYNSGDAWNVKAN